MEALKKYSDYYVSGLGRGKRTVIIHLKYIYDLFQVHPGLSFSFSLCITVENSKNQVVTSKWELPDLKGGQISCVK